MSKLEEFLDHNVEGYMFNDLREMQSISVTYPLLMTTFAGIELLGALFSKSEFDTYSGGEYFSSYWNEHLYPSLKDKEKFGPQLYRLIRHGIAHAFLLKGHIVVGRSLPSLHLTWTAGVLYVDAVRMANDFMVSYSEKVKPLIANITSNVVVGMSKRLAEMEAEYKKQAEAQYHPSDFPSATVATTAAVSHSIALPDPGFRSERDS